MLTGQQLLHLRLPLLHQPRNVELLPRVRLLLGLSLHVYPVYRRVEAPRHLLYHLLLHLVRGRHVHEGGAGEAGHDALVVHLVARRFRVGAVLKDREGHAILLPHHGGLELGWGGHPLGQGQVAWDGDLADGRLVLDER